MEYQSLLNYINTFFNDSKSNSDEYSNHDKISFWFHKNEQFLRTQMFLLNTHPYFKNNTSKTYNDFKNLFKFLNYGIGDFSELNLDHNTPIAKILKIGVSNLNSFFFEKHIELDFDDKIFNLNYRSPFTDNKDSFLLGLYFSFHLEEFDNNELKHAKVCFKKYSNQFNKISKFLLPFQGIRTNINLKKYDISVEEANLYADEISNFFYNNKCSNFKDIHTKAQKLNFYMKNNLKNFDLNSINNLFQKQNLLSNCISEPEEYFKIMSFLISSSDFDKYIVFKIFNNLKENTNINNINNDNLYNLLIEQNSYSKINNNYYSELSQIYDKTIHFFNITQNDYSHKSHNFVLNLEELNFHNSKLNTNNLLNSIRENILLHSLEKKPKSAKKRQKI